MRFAAGTLFLVLLTAPPPAAAADDPPVRLHLPRNILVDADALDVGSIGVVRCADAGLAKRVASVAMGRAPWPKETIVIDRRTILSRLAACGIDAAAVQVTGAASVRVARNEKVLSGEELVALARRLLQEKHPGPDGCTWQAAGQPPEMVVPAAKDMVLQPRLAADAPRGFARVEIIARGLGRQLAKASLLFQVLYPWRRVVTTRDIPAGAAVTAGNTKLERVFVDRKPAGDADDLLGMIAARPLPAGTVVDRRVLRAAQQKVAIRRKAVVEMRVRISGFCILARGEALEDGRPGDYIKVRNIDSQRVVIAKVAPDGAVEPVCQGMKK